MSASGSENAAANGSTAPTQNGQPRRRTLQSGFSLLSRGEPKIWVTGGMLVICLAMIIGLLSLIAINGLATFWPRPIDWLFLKNGQLDIGEAQQVVYRDAGDRDQQALGKAAEPSRFYRTANFDLTARHYRWFEPDELSASGIIRPEWALVIERLSWGRMFALPSRLAVPITPTVESDMLSGLLETNMLMNELADELEPLAVEAAADPSDASSWSKLTEAINARADALRSQQIKSGVAQQLGQTDATVLVQTAAADEWLPVSDQSELDRAGAVSAARMAWDQPDQILSRIAPIVDRMAKTRQAISRSMRQISALDRSLSDARVAVRQAELDTGLAVLVEADKVGLLVEKVFQLQRIEKRIQSAAERAAVEIANAELAGQWQTILTKYQQTSLAMAILVAQSDLDAWRVQFADEPQQVRDAVTNFERTWRQVLESKLPLEERIATLEAESEGFELLVTVPTDARTLDLPATDADELKNGRWTNTAKEELATLGIVPVESSTHVKHLSDHVTFVSFADVARGRQWLWQTTDAADPKTVWLLPPQHTIQCSEIVRIFPANRLSVLGKLAVYGSRWAEFLLDEPREANTEGGVFPAIWGTVVMTLIMTLAVVPFGVIAALYLREYTRSGPLVSLIRISINNLAGVPSIVYGVFGLAFFCYSIGAFIDGGPKNADFGVLPSATWTALLAVTVTVGVAAFLFSLLTSGPEHSLSPVRRILARVAPWLWLLSLICVGVLIFKSPFFDGFYEARLPTPSFGKEGLLWAALTLALLTLPVVIVATEEALAAVPNSLREGSLACGASKWQTIHRIVLPHARPGILTGAILAMARGIGEVAPLMLVGALPVAPDLPLDTEFPYFHGSRNFMHLGYQIYWLGFQSQNSEASKPLVFTCTLLLILIVVALNLSAILLRTRLRRRFLGNQF